MPSLRILLIVVGLAASVRAERYAFRAYGEREGLLNPIIRMAAQDTSGTIWVVTAHGVYRFDGERMEYMHGQGLPVTDVRWATCTADGATWFRAATQVFRHHQGKFDEVLRDGRSRAGEPQAAQTLAAESRGAVWLLNDGRQLERYDGQRRLIREEPAGLWSVLARRDGSVVTGCGQGLCRYAQGEWSAWRVPADRYSALYEGRDGTLYARGRRRVVRLQPDGRDFQDLSAGLPGLGGEQSPALGVDFHRRPLTNTATGIARWENGRWEVIGDGQGFADQLLRSITVDREGGIWLGTVNGFWRWLGDGAWRLLGAAEGLPRSGTEQPAADPHGDIWVTAGAAGVYRGREREGRWRFAPVAGLPAATALITVYRDDAVWVGPHTGGMLRRETATGRLAAVPGVDPRAVVGEFSIDRQGRVVAVTNRGFYREKSPNEMELVVGGREFFTLTEDATGAMWLGGDGAIVRVRGGQAETVPTDDGLEKNGIRALHAATDGRLWAGTWRMDGLHAYEVRGAKLKSVPAVEAPPDKVSAFFIRRDRKNRLWTGTVRGMSYYEDRRWHRFGRAQGLTADQCTGVCFARDGSVWFSTGSGLAQFRPPLERGPSEPPPIVVKGVSARFGPVALEPQPEIPAGQSDLQVDFGVLSTSLDAPPNVRYRLKAAEPWRPVRQRPLEFLNLPAGEYQLELAAQGLAGTWSAVPVALPFRVLPFWWQTWWFRLAAAGVVSALGALAWKMRLRHAQRKNFRQLREMVDRYPGVVFLLDRDGRFVLTNRRMEEFTSTQPNGLIGKRPGEVMSAENAATVERNFRSAWDRAGLWEYSESYSVGGQMYTFDVSAFPLRGEDGELEAICAFATDVTERRRIEAERDQARQRYEAFVRQSTEAIWRVEFEPPVPLHLTAREIGKLCYERGVVREANEAAAAMLGTTLDSVLGRRFVEIRDRHLPHNRRTDLAWYLGQFELREHENEVVDAQGRRRVLLTNAMGVIENGHLVRSWTTQRDVTEQRQLEDLVTNTARGVSAGTGQQFFELLAAQLAKSLEADTALVAERREDGGVEALATAGEKLPELRVDWERVESRPVQTHSELGELLGREQPGRMESYTLVPLRAGGAVAGFLLIGFARGNAAPEQTRAVLEIFAARAGSELERVRAERQVLAYQAQLRALTARTQQIMEYDRASFAREIHDELGQQLTAIKMGLTRVRNLLGKGAAEKAAAEIHELVDLTDTGVKTVRRVSTELRPPALDQLGLAAAIRWQAKEIQQRLGIPVECKLEEFPTGSEVGIAAFRILQECLTNVMRHAEASHVEVVLKREEGELRLTVRDDGQGFEPGTRPGSLGLLGMNERAASVRGTLRIRSGENQGTLVEARLPLT